jgi:hypothetical protein
LKCEGLTVFGPAPIIIARPEGGILLSVVSSLFRFENSFKKFSLILKYDKNVMYSDK